MSYPSIFCNIVSCDRSMVALSMVSFVDGNDSEDDRPNDADLASEEALEVEKWKVK